MKPLCPQCGDKRCLGAVDHDADCTLVARCPVCTRLIRIKGDFLAAHPDFPVTRRDGQIIKRCAGSGRPAEHHAG